MTLLGSNNNPNLRIGNRCGCPQRAERDEITERQVTRVLELTNMTEEQCPRETIVDLLKTMYPREAAAYILDLLQSRPESEQTSEQGSTKGE